MINKQTQRKERKMTKTALIIMVGLLLIGTLSVLAGNLYAAGDLTVTGNLGVGTDTPQQKLDVRGNISVKKGSFNGIYF